MYAERREYEQWITRAPQRAADLEEALRWALDKLADGGVDLDALERRRTVLAKRDPVPNALRKHLKPS